MQQKVYVDTSALILFSNINELSILELVYGVVFITIEIANEYGKALPNWIILDKEIHYNVHLPIIGNGEASLFSVALINKNVLLILDDYKARKLAKLYQIKFTGTIGVLIAAKKLGFIKTLKPILIKINQTNFRLSPEIIELALLLAEE